MKKDSDKVFSTPKIRKEFSEAFRDSALKFAFEKRIAKIQQYLSDNVFFYGTTKTVDARFKDGNLVWKELTDYLRHTRDVEFANYLKEEIEQSVK